MTEVFLSFKTITEIQSSSDDFEDYCSKRECDDCPLYDVPCTDIFYKVKINTLRGQVQDLTTKVKQLEEVTVV